MIDEKISATSPYSDYKSGSELARPGSRAQATNITAQVVPPGGDFEVELQGAVNSVNGRSFTKIGTFKQDDDVFLSTFPVSEGCVYRFRHVSGAECKVLLTG